MPTKTFSQRKEDVKQNWRVVDADGKVLGRMASQIAIALRGKDKPTYTPHIDGGDFIIVVNAEKVKLTGSKWDKKMYHYHTNYRGNVKSRTARQVREENPEELITEAVWGMLPKGPLGRQIIKKLRVFKGPEHSHAAQKPEVLTVQL